VKVQKVAAVSLDKPKKGWSVPLAHPSYSIEPCPNCQYPEADGGYCPECGWTHCFEGVFCSRYGRR